MKHKHNAYTHPLAEFFPGHLASYGKKGPLDFSSNNSEYNIHSSFNYANSVEIVEPDQNSKSDSFAKVALNVAYNTNHKVFSNCTMVWAIHSV